MPEYRVQVDHLRIGVFVRLELKWTQHPFFFKSFKIKDAEQIEILRSLGVSTVICIPEKSDCLPEPPVSNDIHDEPEPQKEITKVNELFDLKQRQIERLREQRERLDACEQKYIQTMARVNKVMTNLTSATVEVVEEADLIIQDMVSSLLNDKENLVHLMNAKAGKQDIFYHAMNTSVLGMILGKECGLASDAIRQLGLGLLFHDIGKFKIPKNLLLKQTPLTRAELELLRMHPLYGTEILAKVPNFPNMALTIVRHHHEAADGSGYPDRLSGNEIPVEVKISSIVDIYDNHCNKHDPRTSLTPAQAISLMFARQKGHLDPRLLAMFVRCIGVYPPGSIVQLSNECVGMVVSVNSRNSLRPDVLIYDQEVPKNEALVFELEADPDVTIVKSIHPGELPSEVYDYLSPRTRVTYFLENSGKQVLS